MNKKPRLGSDPLEWIRDTRKGTDKQSKHSLQSKQIIHRNSKTGPDSIETVKQGLMEGWTRATFIIRDEHLEKVKALAYWDRREIKEIIDEALRVYLKGKNTKDRE